MALICRTCLTKLDKDKVVFFLDEDDPDSVAVWIKTKLKSCVPEVTVGTVKNPAMCEDCVNNLTTASHFRTTCLQTEERICNYMKGNKMTLEYVNIEDVLSANSNGLDGGNTLFRPNNDGAVKVQPVRGLKRKRSGSLILDDGLRDAEEGSSIGEDAEHIELPRIQPMEERVDFAPQILGECIVLLGDSNEDDSAVVSSNPVATSAERLSEHGKESMPKLSDYETKILQELTMQMVDSATNIQKSSSVDSLHSIWDVMNVVPDKATGTIFRENGSFPHQNHSNSALPLERTEPEAAQLIYDIKEESVTSEDGTDTDYSKSIDNESSDVDVESPSQRLLLSCAVCSYTCQYESVLFNHIKTHAKDRSSSRNMHELPKSDDYCYGFTEEEMISRDCKVCMYHVVV